MLGSAGVLGSLAIGGESSDVADADADGVMPAAMCTCLFLGSADMNAAVTIDDEMIAYHLVALSFVPAVDVGYGVVTAFRGGTAMDVIIAG